MNNRIFSLLAACCIAAFTLPALADEAACPRIVSQSPYLTQALKWLGRGECLVGVSRYEREYPDLPRTGGVLDPDKDAIAALKPDILIASNWADAKTMADVTPTGTRLVVVDGFAGMRDAENMLATLAKETDAPADAKAALAAFSQHWHNAAQSLAKTSRHRRVLVLSTCMGSPFSFGREHVIGDIFVQSGFELVETAPKVRHLVAGAEIPDIESMLTQTRPEIVVALTSESAEHCRMIAPQANAKIMTLDGAPFIHPGVGLLQAYEEIRKAFE
ncbi:hypothetical protein AGMMS49545_08710 [Betaproteobacteria bacterium]|nr:hypothetical protein AGMMS49545_08710 [Betaproteobacteria bacterium]GHU41327.1 hypothetical protein AGMMS50289_04290 [Betaproteobacteria bacterium]